MYVDIIGLYYYIIVDRYLGSCGVTSQSIANIFQCSPVDLQLCPRRKRLVEVNK